MRIFVIVYALIITCAFSLNAQVIDYEIDPTFNSELLFNRGNVSDIILTSEDKYMIMGMFSGVNSPVSTGSMLSQFGNLEYANIVGGQKVIEYKNGFLQYGMLIKHVYLPSILSDFRFEFQKQAYTGPLSNVALDAMVMPEDNILVAGRFFTDSTLMGTDQSHLGLRQLCMIDSTGAPVEGFPMLRCAWPVNSEINTIQKLSTGEYIIAGSFDEVDGHPYSKLAKLNPDFSVNVNFEPVFASGSGEVAITYVDSQDRIWVTKAPSATVLTQPNYPGRIIRILSTGSVDLTYQTNIFTTYLGSDLNNPTTPTNTGAKILEDTDGTFIMGGSFIEVNGEPYNRLIKINDAGEIIDGAFGGIGPDAATWGTWTPALGPIAGTFIRVLRKLPDGKLLIGGEFSSFGGEPYSCLVRLQPSGFVGTENAEVRGMLKLWPNPALDYIQVALPGANERIERLEIYDLQGRMVSHVNLQGVGDGRINIQELMPGIYLVRASGKRGVYTQKLVVR